MKALAIALAMTVSGTSIEQKTNTCESIASIAVEVMAVHQAGVPPVQIAETCTRIYGKSYENLCVAMTLDATKVGIAPWEEQKVALVDMFQKRWLRKCVEAVSEKEK